MTDSISADTVAHPASNLWMVLVLVISNSLRIDFCRPQAAPTPDPERISHPSRCGLIPKVTRKATSPVNKNVAFCVALDRIIGLMVLFTGECLINSRKPRAMLSKRHAEILDLLEMEGTVSIANMARHFGVSLETVRRDLKALSETGAVVRIHGAVGLAGQMGEAPFQRRMRENASAKQAIARAVAASISDGESVMLDTGTTTSFVARELMGHRRLTVVTNSSDIARTLATVNGNRVYMAGGELRSDSGAAFG
ncbi:MAG: DeoR/GlpR family DNA-binding transcription regulator, partial [Pseudorhodobacter sp.]